MIAQTQLKRSILRVGIHAVLVLFFLILVLIAFSILQSCGRARIAARSNTRYIPMVIVLSVQRSSDARSTAAFQFRSYSWIPSFGPLSLSRLSFGAALN